MCYNYEDLEHSIRKIWQHDHPGETYATQVEEAKPAVIGSEENDTSVYPGRKGRIILPGEIELREAYFGLVSSWHKKFNEAQNTFNARSDSILTKATWKDVWYKKQRCIVETTGFYETDKKTRKKYRFTVKGFEVFYYAGLYNWWINPENGDKVLTFAIITTDPNDLVSQVHNRMPWIIDQDIRSDWMNPDTALTKLIQLMSPYPAFLMNMEHIVIEKKVKTKPSNQGTLDF